MASTSKIHPKNFNNNNSFKVNTLSTLLSGVKTKTNTGLILTVTEPYRKYYGRFLNGLGI